MARLWRDKLEGLEIISFLNATLPIESKLRLNLNELKDHPFITGKELVGLKVKDTINWINVLGRHMVLVGSHGSLFAVDLRTMKQGKIAHQQEDIYTMAHNGDQFEKEFAILNNRNQITVWSMNGDASIPKCLTTIDFHEGSNVRCLRLSHRYLMSFGSDGMIVVYKYGSWEKLWELSFGTSQQVGAASSDLIRRHSDPHKMVMVGNEVFVAEGEHLKRYVNGGSSSHQLWADLHIRGAKISCVCMGMVEEKDMRCAVVTRDSGRCFWLGTEDGKVLQANLATKSVWREFKVWNKGIVKQLVELHRKYLICCITDPETMTTSVLCYELADLYADLSDQVVIPFRQIADFGCITSDVVIEGHQHVMFYNGGNFNHFVASDIDKVEKTTTIRLHPDYKSVD